jgi:hypothetical protein
MNASDRSRPDGLTLESLGYLNYMHRLLTRPGGSWDGFYVPQSPSMNFALRYQLAFATYALAALAQHTPAYRAPYVEAMRGAIEKMLDAASWGYWRAPARGNASALGESGHVAVLVSPHSRAPAGPPSDPVAHDNLQYSGHLSTMLGLYEKVSGDSRFDREFTLSDPESGVEYVYSHGQVAARIHSQMHENRFGGVCCESGMAYVPCNNHAMASNTLHDALHGTRYRDANAGWLRSVRDKMVLKGPALRGIFGAAYVKDLRMAAPVAFNFTDAWGLAFMLPFDRPLVRRLYRKFRRRVTREGDGAYLGSSPYSERAEISDVPINTGFALIAARGVGDTELADALLRYASVAFGASWRGPEYLFHDAPRTLHATALYALAEAIEPGGEDFASLFNAPPDREAQARPRLESVSSPGAVGVSQARYDPSSKTLRIGLRQPGDPAQLRQGEVQEAILTIAGIHAGPRIEVSGAALAGGYYVHNSDGSMRFSVQVAPTEETVCDIRLA